MLKTRNDFFHEGELSAQERFNSDGFWPDSVLNAQLRDYIDAVSADFIESLPFFLSALAIKRVNAM